MKNAEQDTIVMIVLNVYGSMIIIACYSSVTMIIDEPGMIFGGNCTTF